jgi:hypothetical protein
MPSSLDLKIGCAAVTASGRAPSHTIERYYASIAPHGQEQIMNDVA